MSSSRLCRAQLHRGHSTQPWHVIDGLRVRAVGQRQCRPERSVVTTARPSAERLQSIPTRPRMRWGCTTRDCEGDHTSAGPTSAGAAAGRERMG
jgi:hypothetical protein